MADEFDEDIQHDYEQQALWRLATVAQDLRDTMRFVSTRSLLAAYKRKAEWLKEREKASVKGTDHE